MATIGPKSLFLFLFNTPDILDTTVGYLLGETEQADLFKDKKMLQRLQDILKLPEKEQSSILLTLDHFIKAAKISLI